LEEGCPCGKTFKPVNETTPYVTEEEVALSHGSNLAPKDERNLHNTEAEEGDDPDSEEEAGYVADEEEE